MHLPSDWSPRVSSETLTDTDLVNSGWHITSFRRVVKFFCPSTTDQKGYFFLVPKKNPKKLLHFLSFKFLFTRCARLSKGRLHLICLFTKPVTPKLGAEPDCCRSKSCAFFGGARSKKKKRVKNSFFSFDLFWSFAHQEKKNELW